MPTDSVDLRDPCAACGILVTRNACVWSGKRGGVICLDCASTCRCGAKTALPTRGGAFDDDDYALCPRCVGERLRAAYRSAPS